MPTNPQTEAWADAYLQQARSDWEIYQLLQNEDVHACHPLHYLQMTTEKLSKALLLKGSRIDLKTATSKHKGLTQLMNLAKRRRKPHKQYANINIASFLDIANKIEKLAPALAKGNNQPTLEYPDRPNPEYPWKDNSESVIYPSSYSFWVAGELKTSRGRQFLHLIKRLLEDDRPPF
ncbi:hypothetical protein MNBD_CHLOROFLEXI01-5011 [hydrothermal vent metagenome]|uniref:HEPN domain-containing protein n=1 Tax=hydrothermal vent metagenome TaxID=652676 RepID=A0A3B0V513_9ZZZZ